MKVNSKMVKKKTPKVDPLSVYDDERLVSNFDKQQDWPKVEKGSHLTVYTYSDGSTKLEWDHEALLRDVNSAILNAESTIPVATEKPKRRTKKA